MKTSQTDKSSCHVPIGVDVLLIRENHLFLLKRIHKDWGFGVIAAK